MEKMISKEGPQDFKSVDTAFDLHFIDCRGRRDGAVDDADPPGISTATGTPRPPARIATRSENAGQAMSDWKKTKRIPLLTILALLAATSLIPAGCCQ